MQLSKKHYNSLSYKIYVENNKFQMKKGDKLLYIGGFVGCQWTAVYKRTIAL